LEVRGTALVEREGELAAIEGALERARSGSSGGALLIEGPAGIGKTALLGELGERAKAAGMRVLGARGSEMEREFGFGVVRQLFGSVLRGLSDEERARLFVGPAALAAAILGFGSAEGTEVGGAEASLYGLFWLLAGLAEFGPLVLAIDDAHWCDASSLRFVQYLGRRLDGLPVFVALAARPNEPGVEAEMLRGLTTSLDVPTIRPSLLSADGTAALVRSRLGDAAPDVTSACFEATGGNPLLIKELLAELDPAVPGATPAPISPDRVATMGPERIAAEVLDRALKVDATGPAVVRAVAVLGEGTDLATVAALAEVDPDDAVAIVDRLAAASILAATSAGHGFVHPLLRSSIYEDIPAASRARSHARAAELLRAREAEAEEVAAHLLLCEPGTTGDDTAAILEAAAARAAARGAPESAAAYLRRALPELRDRAARADLLRRLGSAEVALRDPASIGHLAQAAELTDDPERAIGISLELMELLSIAGMWTETVQTAEAALARFGDLEVPGVLDIEAGLAATRAYDPARVGEFDRDLPRLRALVEGRTDDESAHLRWVIACMDAERGAPVADVLALLDPARTRWTTKRHGRESSFVGQAMFALLMLDAEGEGERVVTALLEEARTGGSLMAMLFGLGLAASIESRSGDLAASEAQLAAALELITDNDMNLMALTTVLNFCLDTVVERRALESTAALVQTLELPSPFGETQSGAMLGEVRAAVLLSRGDRAGAVEVLRTVGSIYGAADAGPRLTRWRSRLALALPEESREEALALAREELELTRALGEPRAEAVALRALGLVEGGKEGIGRLRESVALLRDGEAVPLELARSLAELGAALRRANRRSEARAELRDAADLAQRCGAEALEERILEEMRIAGAKPRRRAISGSDSLTPGEQRVARAAAAGASNREIAQELFVSLRTVEMHLTNTYRKLGITSRAELVGAIAEASPT
jgi:DNA-binding CsgD family transcriptional regulator